NNINMLPILCYKAAWMTEPPHTEQDFADFGNYVSQVVGRYKGRIKVWEVWNEPNIPTVWKPPNAKDYARLLMAAYAAAKKADPPMRSGGRTRRCGSLRWVGRPTAKTGWRWSSRRATWCSRM